MKKKIALVTGGFSGEAQISYKSATTIYNHLDKALFDVYRIDISQDGWIYEDEDGKRSAIDKNDFSINTGARKVLFDAVFIGMHGTPGEDGKLQGYFDLLHIPYTSCGAAASALTFNKRYTVAVAAMAGIHVARPVIISSTSTCSSSAKAFCSAGSSCASLVTLLMPMLEPPLLGFTKRGSFSCASI